MVSNNPVLKRYIRSISRKFPSGKMKEPIIAQIRECVVDYMQEHPEADFEMVQAHFGTPQEIAESYVNEQDMSTLLHKMSIKKKVLVIVAGVMATIFLMWVGFVAWRTYMSKASIDRYITQNIGQNEYIYE